MISCRCEHELADGLSFRTETTGDSHRSVHFQLRGRVIEMEVDRWERQKLWDEMRKIELLFSSQSSIGFWIPRNKCEAMPIRQAIWKVAAQPQPPAESSLTNEKLLENIIVAAPCLLSDDWMLIGRQGRRHWRHYRFASDCADGALVLI
jgi:hypothetical protein